MRTDIRNVLSPRGYELLQNTIAFWEDWGGYLLFVALVLTLLLILQRLKRTYGERRRERAFTAPLPCPEPAKKTPPSIGRIEEVYPDLFKK